MPQAVNTGALVDAGSLESLSERGLDNALADRLFCAPHTTFAVASALAGLREDPGRVAMAAVVLSQEE